MDLNATIFGQALSFIFFVWFCMKYIWPPIILAIETRQAEVRKSLKNVQQAKKDLYSIRKNIAAEIQASKEKALMIIQEANQQKVQILEVAKKQSVEMSKSIILKTRTNLEIEVIEARKNLHDETVDLAISIAKKIIKKNIQKNDYQDILDDFSSKLSQVKNSCLH